MKTIRILIAVVITFAFTSLVWAVIDRSESDKTQKLKVIDIYGRLPFYFIQNNGQVDERVMFYEKGVGHMTFFTKEGVYISLFRGQKTEGKDKDVNSEFIKLLPLNTKEDSEVVAEEELSGRINYFIGNDPKKWIRDIPIYGKVRYREVYPGIDLVFYGNQKQLEYDVVVKPGAEARLVSFRVEGAKEIRNLKEGGLEIELSGGSMIIQKIPRVYQKIEGKNVEVLASFEVRKDKEGYIYNFNVKEYDKNQPLIIDPVVLTYSTYLGGSGYDYGNGIAVDSSGNAYVTGWTLSINFPTLNAYQGSKAGNYDAFVTKLDPSQSGINSLIYSTYLGGSSWDEGHGIAVDSQGNAYVTGWTSSTNFPKQNAYQESYGGGAWDVFVTKLNPSGNSLIYSTYLGGSDHDYGNGIAVDSSGNAYVTGYTTSTNFPTTPNAYDTTYNGGSSDAFVTKLDPSQSGINSLIYSTYIGGSGDDAGRGIAVDSSGNAYVTGGRFSIKVGNYDAFVTKLDPSQSGINSLIYSIYLGGSGDDEGNGIAVDSSGNAYVTGYTESANFPTTPNAYDKTCGTDGNCNGYKGDIFVTKLNSSGNILIYSTYLGGSGVDGGYGIAVDSSGNAYVTGFTSSTDFPTKNAYQGDQGSYDAFVTKLDPSKSGTNSLIYSTYLGGISWDGGYGIAVDSSGNAYVTGYTESADFPTKNAYQGDQGSYDAFVTKVGVPTQCEGDFDVDGDVDGSDLVIFAADFGRTDCKNAGAPPCEGDFDGDGDVDGSDLAIFTANFGKTNCPH